MDEERGKAEDGDNGYSGDDTDAISPALTQVALGSGEPGPSDIGEEKARLIVEQLMERDVVSMPSDEPILIHEPSGAVFDSIVNLAHFHLGWTARSGPAKTGDGE